MSKSREVQRGGRSVGVLCPRWYAHTALRHVSALVCPSRSAGVVRDWCHYSPLHWLKSCCHVMVIKLVTARRSTRRSAPLAVARVGSTARGFMFFVWEYHSHFDLRHTPVTTWAARRAGKHDRGEIGTKTTHTRHSTALCFALSPPRRVPPATALPTSSPHGSDARAVSAARRRPHTYAVAADAKVTSHRS